MTAEADMKLVLSYIGNMAVETRTASGDWNRKVTLKTQASWKVAIGTLTCELSHSL